MNSVWRNSQATGRARMVLLAIADHQGEMGAWPSIETLAKMCNASKRSISRDIAELVELGELEVHEKSAPMGGQYRANLYWVLPDMTKRNSDMTDSVSDMTNGTSDMTAQTSDMTAGGTQTLKETLETLKETKKVVAHLIPDDWHPAEDDWNVMAEHFPWVDLKLQTHAFNDYWRSVPPAKAKKVDWDRTWKNWIRRVAEQQKPKGYTGPTKKYKF